MAVNPLSIIIPTKNEAKHIAACVDAFMPFLGKGVREILVIDNFSTDHTVALATARGARVLSQGPERSTQRNAGWKTASGEYVFFVDADMTVPAETIREILRALACAEPPDAFYVREIRVGKGWWIRVRNFERGFYDATCIDGLRVIRRSLLEQVGGYDEKLYACEDWDLDHRLLALTRNVRLTAGHLLHNEGDFSFRRHLHKKAYYAGNFNTYLAKWPDDPIVRRQFSPFYRFVIVFMERGKWKRALSHPHYMLAIFFERFCVALAYLFARRRRALKTAEGSHDRRGLP